MRQRRRELHHRRTAPEEWADAIAAAVAGRMQRDFITVLESWRTGTSQTIWGVSFLPHASTFSDPATNDLCGDVVSGVGVTEGMMPFARATSSCTFWGSPFTFTKVGGSGTLNSWSCGAVSAAWRCQFSYRGTITVRVTATAPNVTGAFRDRILSTDVRVPLPAGTTFTTSSFSLSGPSSTGSVSVSVDVGLPNRATSTTTIIEIKHLPEPTWPAPTDALLRWFIQNDWARYTYYAISPGARAVPGLTCNSPGASGCITVNGLPSGSGNANDKRVVLALMGRPIGSQTAAALEAASHAMPNPATYTGVPAPFTVSRALTTNNDRLAMCPYRYTSVSGSTVIPCN
jgi:hypothetical protein